jgi:hypothetical protein
MTRFDLEQAIMSVWNITNDIDVVTKGLLNDNLTKDEVANTLIGMSTLQNLRMNELFDIFETLIKNGDLS